MALSPAVAPALRRVTIATAAGRWLRLYIATTRNPKGARLACVRVHQHLLPFLGDHEVAEIRPDDLRLYRLHLQGKDLAPNTVVHLLSDARCLLLWCVESGDLERSPFTKRLMPKLQERPPDRLSDDEVAKVLSIPEPWLFMVKLGLATGLRWAEMCRLQAEDLRGEMLLIHNTKSGRMRRVPLPPALLSEVRRRKGQLVHYAVCSPGGFSRLVQRRSGVKHFHVHQLRHTMACRWIEAGGTLASLQQILGHQDVRTTQRYARLSDEAVRLEARRIFSA